MIVTIQFVKSALASRRGFFFSAQQEKALTMLEWAARHTGARD
ncbi:hypothetical protein [Enterobacter roggenkampii]